jgi:peptidoglycan-N-acetylglucosamine deacetylase
MLLISRFVTPIPWWAFALLWFPYSGALVWGACNVSSGFYMPVICSADTKEKVIAITFDDGPLQEYTPQILDILHQHQAPAAFFCIGKNISGREELLKKIDAEGHVIGNHSFTHHFWFDMFGSRKMLAELQQMDNEVSDTIGKKPRLFRPPYGVTNPNLRRAVKRGGYAAIGWNIRSLDTVTPDAATLLNRIKPAVRPGAVLLLHDSMAVTVQALPELLTYLRTEGYRIERIDQLLNIPAYA